MIEDYKSVKLGKYTITATPVQGTMARRYTVAIGNRRLGSLFSVPGIEDCKRMENPPAPVPYSGYNGFSNTVRRSNGGAAYRPSSHKLGRPTKAEAARRERDLLKIPADSEDE